ncbi:MULTISPECIES: nucleotidyltransferase family protein [Protofrankia]|uniref:MobA-like NTP transferase domain-containing protein n=1 Tax=Candidatus Protofrankia datiscae TaxID=2716812 RepID=F8AUW5_9ACTN|nr:MULTISPECIES: nucleotidyltransferase family protein [Protofrankia]AEH08165.1 hypothetical protein FsymDg_0639 [Candidatus Protofrankia datiscae]
MTVTTSTVGGLVLAAGAGRRFGVPKALVTLSGEPLVQRCVRMLTDGGCAPVLVALGARATDVIRSTGLPEEQVVLASDWAVGMSASLRRGLTAFAADEGSPAAPADGGRNSRGRKNSRGRNSESWNSGQRLAGHAGVEAVVIALADQPLIGAEAVCRLLAAHAAGAVAAVASYGGQPRNPVLLHRTVWAEVSALAHGDVGARAWLRTNPDRVVMVPCDDTGSPYDIDTPDDLAALVTSSPSTSGPTETRPTTSGSAASAGRPLAPPGSGGRPPRVDPPA